MIFPPVFVNKFNFAGYLGVFKGVKPFKVKLLRNHKL